MFLLTCHQVSFTHFPLWSLTLENGPSDARQGPGLVKGSPVLSRAGWPAGKKGVLFACYVTRRGDRAWGRGHNNGPSQVGRAHQLSVFSCNLRKWNLVKLVVLLSSNCMTYVSGGRERGVGRR